MTRVARWRMWLGSWIMGSPPRSVRAVFVPAGTPWWKRQWYRMRPPSPPPAPSFSEERMRRRLKWLAPPDNEVGVGVAGVQGVLAQTDTSAVVLTHCVAYTNGFALGLGIRYKVEPERPRFANPRAIRDPYEPPQMSLALQIRFADGRESQWGGGRAMPAELQSFLKSTDLDAEPPEPVGPVIGGMSGGGGGRRWDQQYWVSPLAPDGAVTVTCHWPAGGVPEGQVAIDGTAIRRAGESSRKLWPD